MTGASAAERMKRHRDRQRANRIAVRGDVSFETVSQLIEAGELTEDDATDAAKIVAALDRFARAAN